MSTTVTTELPTGSPQLGRLTHGLLSHAGLATLVLLFFAVTLGVSILIHRPFEYGMAGRLSQLYSVLMPVFLALLLVAAFLRTAFVDKPQSPARHLGRAIRDFVFDPERLLGMAVMSMLVVLFMASFAFMKDSIPILNPFGWDSAFEKMDKFLFAGTDPWRLTFALFGTPYATTALNAVYHLWVFVIYMFLLAAVCGVLKTRLKLVFLYAFMLTWMIGGCLLATLLSSAGPVYFARLGLGGNFEPQMELLRRFNEVSPVWSLTVQEMLWQSYVSGPGMISGISAMPSMHVASSVVVTLLAYRLNRRFGHVLLVFTALMMIGSVHLGWHYAVDGLFGAIVALACWYVAEWVATLDLAFQRRILSRVGGD